MNAEGNLPASFADMHHHVDELAQSNEHDDITSLAQLILRQCFRTVKGSSSILEWLVCSDLTIRKKSKVRFYHCI